MGNPFGDGKGGKGVSAGGHDFMKDPVSNPAGVKGHDFVANPSTMATAPRNPMDADGPATSEDDEVDEETAAPTSYPHYDGIAADHGVGSVGNPAKPFTLNGSGE
jgi:hypothetical protein